MKLERKVRCLQVKKRKVFSEMKRLLSVLLVLVIVLSMMALVACNKEEDPSDAPVTPDTSTSGDTTPDGEEITPEMLENSKPNEYLREKAAAGMKPIIAFEAPTLSTDYMVAMDTGFQRLFEEAGFSYTSQAFDATTTKLVEHLENYSTMGVSIILVYFFDSGAQDIVADLAELGTSVVSVAYAADFPVSMAYVTDEGALGELAAKMALAWKETQYPNAKDSEIHAATLKNDMNTSYVVRFEKVIETLEAGGVPVTFDESNPLMTVDTGYTFAEAAMLADPEIRIFVAMTSSEVTGINNYVTSQSYSDEELIGYGAFSCDNDNAFRTLIDAAGAGERSIARGLVSSGSDDPSEYLVKCVFDLIDGIIEDGTHVYTPLYSYNSFGFDYDERT